MAIDVQRSLDMGNARRILNLPAPASTNEPARLGDLQSAIEGLAWKDSVRVASQVNLTISAPGSAIDGVTMAANDRVLVMSQTTQSQNGIYIWNGAATPMTRSLDASSADELENAVVSVDEGSSAGATYRQTQVNFTLDSGNVIWGSFGATVPSATETTAGKIKAATQAEVDNGTDDTSAVTPLKLANWSGRTKKYSSTLGDGSATSFSVTHNFGSRDVEVSIYRNSGNYDSVLAEVQRPSINTVNVIFDSPPALNAFRVVVRV